MQQDNNPDDTSHSTKAWLKKKVVSDLNPEELLWKDLKRAINVRKSTKNAVLYGEMSEETS